MQSIYLQTVWYVQSEQEKTERQKLLLITVSFVHTRNAKRVAENRGGNAVGLLSGRRAAALRWELWWAFAAYMGITADDPWGFWLFDPSGWPLWPPLLIPPRPPPLSLLFSPIVPAVFSWKCATSSNIQTLLWISQQPFKNMLEFKIGFTPMISSRKQIRVEFMNKTRS